jgi:hypothetical protein
MKTQVLFVLAICVIVGLFTALDQMITYTAEAEQENARRSWAIRQRECKLLLELAADRSDSMRVLLDSDWKTTQCSRALVMDTTEAG